MENRKRKFDEIDSTDSFKVTISYTCNFYFNDHIYEEVKLGERQLNKEQANNCILDLFELYMNEFAERLRIEEWADSVICCGTEPKACKK
ncbi:Hypothetical protein PACV_133 [Pacmanvirus A23]|uniref:Hypothetical protein n=1 Tax=Pacmanvirus A23 TaxID=1932881 RepID=UPI000A095643|nr:Hypothetical protein B9W72_gp132 [Pacmanvirus A23]SIP85849.1 Hypothetical protein PACV_133 [Pacmanvirus A23]